ncbi:hypothetical protein DFS34DRAFT_419771 [Phlyctochytrium arcticum]|nr:hypothetical protein DFS34DRAFT_419771 [Phlyctochytrium arcticum]
MAADPQAVAKSFVDYYYQTFDTNRAGLAALYKENSMMTFEGQPFGGSQSIVEKLSSLPFSRVAHKVATCDAQPGSPNGSILVVVTGQLMIDEESQPQFFAQTFHLYPEGSGFFVFNGRFYDCTFKLRVRRSFHGQQMSSVWLMACKYPHELIHPPFHGAGVALNGLSPQSYIPFPILNIG